MVSFLASKGYEGKQRSMNTDIAYKYLHPRHFKSPYVPGLPARDIYEHELLANDGWQKLLEEHIANGGGTFEKVEAPKKTAKKTEPVVDEPKSE